MYQKSSTLHTTIFNGCTDLLLKIDKDSPRYTRLGNDFSSILMEISAFRKKITAIIDTLPKVSHQWVEKEGTIDWERIEQEQIALPQEIVQEEELRFFSVYQKTETYIKENNLGNVIKIPAYDREDILSFMTRWEKIRHILKKPTKNKSRKDIPTTWLRREIAGAVTRLLNAPERSSLLQKFLSGNATDRKVLRQILDSVDPKNQKDTELIQVKTLLEAASVLNTEQKFPGITEKWFLENETGIQIKSTNYPTLTFTYLHKMEWSIYAWEAEYIDSKTGELKKKYFHIQLSSLYTLNAINIWDTVSGKAIPDFFVSSFQKVARPKKIVPQRKVETPKDEPETEKKKTWKSKFPFLQKLFRK